MGRRLIGKIISSVFSVVFLLTLLFLSASHVVSADTSTVSTTVEATVPKTGVISGGDTGDKAPVISNITTTTRMTSAIVEWQAEDDNEVKSCELKYSPGINYDKVASSSNVSGIDYKAEIVNLSATTSYNFKIKCFDDVQSSEKKGSFTTLGEAIIDLELFAIPEKRVEKKGGNLSVDFILLFTDTQDNLIKTVTGTTDQSGFYSQDNLKVGAGKAHAFFKGRSHLAKKIIGVNIKDGGKVSLDFSDGGKFKLKAGDVAGTHLKDNFVDILDLSALISIFNTSNKDGDLNRDGLVDVLDLSILLNNFNQSGDALP